jgi:putative transposase
MSLCITLVRYVERNAKRAALVKWAEEWPWSSGYTRPYGNARQKKLLRPWPVPEPQNCLQWVNASQPKEEVGNIRYAIQRSRPKGWKEWVSSPVAQFGFENTLRSRGRPGKGT